VTVVDQNFEVYQGNHKVVTVTVLGGNGTPLTSLAGATITWSASKTSHSDALIAKSTTASTITISGGTCSFTLLPTDTENLLGEYYHEGKVIDASSNVSTGFTGTMTITEALLS
jgi:hypothetical protein